MSFLSDTISGFMDRVCAGAHPTITMIGTGVGLLGFLVDRPLIIVGGIGFILIGRLTVHWLQWRRHRLPETQDPTTPYDGAGDALPGGLTSGRRT